MSEWCSAEIYLGAPDFILKMLPEISMRSDSIHMLAAEFVRAADLITTDINPAQFNSTPNVCAAALHYIETIPEFTSFADRLCTLQASVIPSVMGSIFLGGLCLWFSLKVIRIWGRSNPATEEKVLLGFWTALSLIRWGPQDLSATDDAFIVLLGDLTAQTQLWGIMNSKLLTFRICSAIGRVSDSAPISVEDRGISYYKESKFGSQLTCG
jgi:hypothetical protein